MPAAPTHSSTPASLAPIRRGEVLVHDATVRPRSPGWSALWCLVSFGIAGAVRHGRINAELARVGRARGTMPFPFVRVDPPTAVLAWLGGLLIWCFVAASVVQYVLELFDGYDPVAADITTFTGQALLLAPMWITQLHTGRRLRTVQHLVGVHPVTLQPWHLALAGVTVPPVATWLAQRAANRAWREWRIGPGRP